MTTDDLVRSLGTGVVPVRRGAIQRHLALGLTVGAAGTLTIVAMRFGFRHDLGTAMQGSAFWTKFAYTVSLGVIAILAAAHLARPEACRPRWLWLLAVPVMALVVVAAEELMRAPRAAWPDMWLGFTWRVCSMAVAMLSLPIFGGLMLAYRHLAPTRLRLTGAVAGLAAGAFGAALYCLHCPEVSAAFVLIWYTLGIVVAAAIGAVIGPRLLRW